MLKYTNEIITLMNITELGYAVNMVRESMNIIRSELGNAKYLNEHDDIDMVITNQERIHAHSIVASVYLDIIKNSDKTKITFNYPA